MTALLFLLAAAAAPPPMKIAPAEAQAFLQRLYTRHGRVGDERVTVWTGEGCATELKTATRMWRIDWTKGRVPAAIEVNKGNRIGTPLAGEAGFLVDAAGAPVATISIVTPNSMNAIKASFVVDGLVAACRRH
jgi:hypothetical protein